MKVITSLSLLSLTLHLTSLVSHTLASPINSFVYGGCSDIKYTPNSPYESNLNSLLTSLVNSATYSSYNNYTIMASSPQDAVRGLYQCRGDISMPDCATCVARAVSQVSSICPATCGAAVQLGGCYIKFDNTTFLGEADKTVVLKKCGPSEGFDTGAMGRRDAVLEGLVDNAGGFYRSGGSGDVQGVGQCIGDLSARECQDCLATAVGRIKSECGAAVYGDVFLGKCYVRYATDGADLYYKSHKKDPSSNAGEKTFAIIIGLLAGVALLIIFLVFMKKVFGGNGK